MKLDAPETREIDYTQTRKNVTKWFDVEYSKYQRLASLSLLPNNILSLAPASSTSHANNVEDRTVDRANAKQVIEFVNAILDTLEERSQKIIRKRYIKNYLDWQVAQSLQYGTTRYNELKLKACYEFAQTLDMTAGTNLVAYKDTPK